MERISKALFFLILFFIGFIVRDASVLNDVVISDKAVFWFVYNELELKDDISFPEIHYADTRKELVEKYFEFIENDLINMRENYGAEAVGEYLATIKTDLNGFFSPKTLGIYVRPDTPCERKATLAHETTHYFQEITWDSNYYDPDMFHWLREIQAYAVEETFKTIFCSE